MSKVTSSAREKLDPERWLRLKDILADALEQATPTARTALVQKRCANDETLRMEAAALVREAEVFLREPTDSFEDCAEQATVALWEDETARAGWRIGAYVVTRELGRGGMGTVYLAERADGQFQKEVAIKVLKRGTDTEEVLRRFAAERHILARLDHPNIAHLLDAGTTDDGLPYVVMEHVAGMPVNRFIREHNLSIPERLAIFLKICAAVEMAHHHHVIHRDLKPSNILVTAEGEPKLLDFGIAKLLGPGKDCLEVTAAGEQRLTPNCASPEQTDGRPVTEASDVYALGALLYEMLCGQKPHKFSSAHPPREEIVRVIREEEPAWPSAVAKPAEVAKQLRGNLDAIVLHALRKEPKMRYPTVAELAADVRRHLAHEPVRARRGTAGYRARSFLVRHRRGLRLAAGAGALLLFALALVLWNRNVQRRPAEKAPLPKSIAVLPFDILGKQDDTSYFADSIQDNILTDLAKVDDLKVISRSGVAVYRGEKKSVREIGRELGVAHVLEGSVQMFGDRLRVNAQLIDTQTDTQEWAEQYDRKLEDILSLQSELAQTIAGQLRVRLSSREKEAIWQRPTEDLQAYDLYLRARAIFMKTGLDDATPLWNEAIQLLDQAVKRDPNFVLAWCLLNDVHIFKYRFGAEHSQADLEAAKSTAETALRLQPDSEETRLAMARYYYHGLSNYRRTLEELARVPQGAHEAGFYALASVAERRLGLWADSVRDGLKGIELDPNNIGMVTTLMQTYTGLRHFAESIRLADATILRLPPKNHGSLSMLKQEALLGEGDLAGAEAALQAVKSSGDEGKLPFLWVLYLKRDYAAATVALEAATEDDRKAPLFWIFAGSIGRAKGDPALAQRSFETAKKVTEKRLQARPNDPELLSSLGLAEAALGNKEEGLNLAQRAFDLVPPGVDALVSPGCGVMLAQVKAWNGDRDGALQLLARLVKMPFGPNYGELRYSPAWDSLRSDPRFDQLVAEAKVAFPL